MRIQPHLGGVGGGVRLLGRRRRRRVGVAFHFIAQCIFSKVFGVSRNAFVFGGSRIGSVFLLRCVGGGVLGVAAHVEFRKAQFWKPGLKVFKGKKEEGFESDAFKLWV